MGFLVDFDKIRDYLKTNKSIQDFPINKVIKHDKLFSKYPFVKKVIIKFVYDKNANVMSLLAYPSVQKIIIQHNLYEEIESNIIRRIIGERNNIYGGGTESDARRQMYCHELSHVFQIRYGLNAGYSKSNEDESENNGNEAKNEGYKEHENLNKKALNYAGEIESKEVEKRLLMNEVIRKHNMPFNDYIINNDIIIELEDKTDFENFKLGGTIQNKWKAIEKMTKQEAKEFYNTKEGKALDKETYTKWKKLVNMSKSELKDFYESKDGKEAGLSASEAKEEGIDSGRESARWIMKMIDVPYTEWTPEMWRWAKKQISFISRMSGMKGDLYDDKGNKTRKHTSLLIWGHNPEKFNNGGEIKIDEYNNDGSLKLMKWYIDWYKGISDKMNITLSFPNVLSPFKEKNVVIMDLFEKINQTIDAKIYLQEIINKADEYKVTIYLEPMPRYKYFLKNIEKRRRISKEYLISYYEKFGFELTTNRQFMKRKFNEQLKNGGEIKTNEMENKKNYDYNNPIKREDVSIKDVFQGENIHTIRFEWDGKYYKWQYSYSKSAGSLKLFKYPAEKDLMANQFTTGIKEEIIYNTWNTEQTTDEGKFVEFSISKWNKKEFFSNKELDKAIKVESEHLDTAKKLYNQEITPEQAPESIAKEHLAESPKYYKELEKMEDKIKEDETGKTINSYSVKNWDEVPQVWKNTNEIKKVNFVNSPYNKELIKIVTPFTGTDPLRPIMSGVHFDENGITCTDAHKLITLPYPNKDFNGTYATVSKKYLADEEIKKDLFTATKYPKYEAVIPKVGDAIRVHEISLYKILQYTNVAQNYVNKSTYQVVYSLGDTSIGFNSKFLTEIIETALKLGHKKLYAFTRNPNNAVVFSTSKNYTVGKDEIFLLMPTIVYTSNNDVVVNGAYDFDFGRELLVYFDFSKDAIVNQDGTIAEFKMNYGDYDVIKSSDIKMLKDFGGKNPAIVLLENFKVDNGKIYASYLDRYNENFLTIKNIDLKNGIYNVLDNAIEYNPNEAISGFDEFPNPKTDLGETKLKFIINSEVLTHYIKTAVDFTGNDDIRPVMMGILLDYNNKQLFLASTNAHVMFKKNITEYCEINKDIPDFQIILPKINLLKFLDNIDESPLVVTCTPNYIKFENDGYEFITKKIDGKYPTYNQVIPSYKSKKLNINIKDLFICINSDEAKSFIKENPKTDISIYDRPTTNNELDIYLGISNSESRYRESQANRSELKIEKEVKICTVNYTKEEGSFQMKDSVYLIMPMMLPTEGNFVFNVKYFREILEVCNTETLELYYDEKNRAYIIQGDALSYGKTMSGKKKEDKKKVAESEIRPIEITELKAEPKKVEAISNEELSGKTDTQLKTAIANFTKFVEGYEDILSKWKNGNSNTIDGKFYTGADIRYFKQKLPMYKEMLLEYQSELDRRSKKEQTPEQKEWQDAISTFEELVSLGGSKKELKEWKEAIDTFKMLLEDDTEKFAKGGDVKVKKVNEQQTLMY